MVDIGAAEHAANDRLALVAQGEESGRYLLEQRAGVRVGHPAARVAAAAVKVDARWIEAERGGALRDVIETLRIVAGYFEKSAVAKHGVDVHFAARAAEAVIRQHEKISRLGRIIAKPVVDATHECVDGAVV